MMKSSTLRTGLFLVVCWTAGLAAQQQLIEVRNYPLTSTEKTAQFDRMMKEAAIPALHRLGATPVGVFKLQEPKEPGDELRRIVVTPFPSYEAFVNMTETLGQDEQFMDRCGEYLEQDKDSPAFDRIEITLLKSFTGMPQLKVPGSGAGKNRLFELRIYESHSELKGKAKVAMFNNGEIDLFHRVGLNGVFFGEALAGKNLPQLTYMLVHEDAETKKSHWKTFVDHPEWKQMSALPEYADTVSKITVLDLVALEYSEIQ